MIAKALSIGSARNANAPQDSEARRRIRVLAVALAASLGLHLAMTQWKIWVPGEAAPLQPLAVAITELPPPPAPPAPVPAKPKPRPKRHLAPVIPVAPATVEPEPVTTADAAPEPATPPPPVESEPVAPDTTEPAIAATEPPKPVPPLPARVDLVYRAFLGTHGFLIGEAVYRFEHDANHYSISTVAEARGLAALFFRGQGKLASQGTITAAGLQPNSYSVERTSDNRRESTLFDYESGVVMLNGDNAAPLELPTFDPLTMLWQFYFAPPKEDDDALFNIATTRKVYHYRFRRDGTETVTLPFGEVATEIWRRESGDGAVDARIWLAPSLHFVAVKVRLSNERGTLEAVLAEIRADQFVAQQ